jgi:tetratricopeptide (TPR) repeat protein
MNEGPSANKRNVRIRELDRVLERTPEALEARYERASLLREQGLFEEAKSEYLELLRRKPGDFGALNDFGTLALKTGYTDAARSLFSEAVRHHPDNPAGRVNLANLLLLLGEHQEARAHFEAALRIDSGHAHAHRGMGNLLAELGDAAGARQHRDKGFRDHSLTALPYAGDGPPVRVLLLVSAIGGNIPTAALLDEAVFQTTVLATEYFDLRIPLPPHDLVFNSIGDADMCREGLVAACAILARTSRPVINHPRAVLKTGRAANVERLRGLPNVIVPRIATLRRAALARPAAADMVARNGFGFPLLVRAPGFHTGHHFARVESADALADAVEKFPGDDVWLIEQLNAQDREGMFRKYRVMIVDRQLYPLHMAISRDWKVHYFTADMAEAAGNRAKEADFLKNMTGVFGERGIAALERIKAALELDYGGIDFAVDAQGDILFFEANATMAVVPPSSDEKWAYRRPAFDRIFAAVRGMLMERSMSSGAPTGSVDQARDVRAGAAIR